MKQALSHIFDSSVCITRRQLKDYVTGTISDEECHAMEHHVNHCSFCSDALDGILSQGTEETIAVIADFNNNFLRAHFSLSDPQVHLNSMGPSMYIRNGKQQRKKPFWLKTSVIVLLITGASAIIFLQISKGIFSVGLKHLAHNKLADKKQTTYQASNTLLTLPLK